MITSAKHLVFHGTLVLLFGLLLGAPFGKAINRGAPAHIVNSWRIAHQSLPIAAILMFSVAALLSSFSVPSTVSWVIAGGLIVSSYFFCVSMPLAAITGHTGLTRGKNARKHRPCREHRGRVDLAHRNTRFGVRSRRIAQLIAGFLYERIRLQGASPASVA